MILIIYPKPRYIQLEVLNPPVRTRGAIVKTTLAEDLQSFSPNAITDPEITKA